MTSEMRLYDYLNLRRRIDRKILLDQKWDLKSSFRNRLKIFLVTKKVKSLWLKDKQFYWVLNNEIKNFATKNNLIKKFSGLQLESVNSCKLIPGWFANLKTFDKRLQDNEARLIIQGSFADSKTTNYSDIDLVIFYKPFSENVLKIKKEIEVFLLQVDPLQHHGIFMIDVNTFDFYWQMDLPVEVLKKAKCFSDDKWTLNIKGILIENSGALHAVKSIFIIIEQFLDKDYRQIGLWEWKFFISQLLLLPTLLLGSKGNYIYKRDSFDIVKKMFSNEAWYCITRSSEIRDNWPAGDTLKEYEDVRVSVAERPLKDPLKAIDFTPISIANDLQFYDSLKALIKETGYLISND